MRNISVICFWVLMPQTVWSQREFRWIIHAPLVNVWRSQKEVPHRTSFFTFHIQLQSRYLIRKFVFQFSLSKNLDFSRQFVFWNMWVVYQRCAVCSLKKGQLNLGWCFQRNQFGCLAFLSTAKGIYNEQFRIIKMVIHKGSCTASYFMYL